MIKNGKASTPNVEAQNAEILAQYKDFLSTLDLVQFPHLLDLVSILSEANSVASGKLLCSMLNLNETQLNKEFGDSIDETYTVCTHITIICTPYFSAS